MTVAGTPLHTLSQHPHPKSTQGHTLHVNDCGRHTFTHTVPTPSPKVHTLHVNDHHRHMLSQHPRPATHFMLTTATDTCGPNTHTQRQTPCKQLHQTYPYLSVLHTVPGTASIPSHTDHVNNRGRHTSVPLTLSPEPHPHSATHIV